MTVLSVLAWYVAEGAAGRGLTSRLHIEDPHEPGRTLCGREPLPDDVLKGSEAVRIATGLCAVCEKKGGVEDHMAGVPEAHRQTHAEYLLRHGLTTPASTGRSSGGEQ